MKSLTLAEAKRMGLIVSHLTDPQREVLKRQRERFEDTLAAQLFALRAPGEAAPIRQYRFDPSRKWMADFAWTSVRLIVEVDGGTYLPQSSHGRGGYEKDRRRDLAAMLAGWTILRVTPAMVVDGSAAPGIARVLANLSAT